LRFLGQIGLIVSLESIKDYECRIFNLNTHNLRIRMFVSPRQLDKFKSTGIVPNTTTFKAEKERYERKEKNDIPCSRGTTSIGAYQT